ncbi:MAG: membrane dipeptidase [Rhizobiaceae bacterium]|nr:membrane dipeptidase [Rhizobiaceae bacterium]
MVSRRAVLGGIVIGGGALTAAGYGAYKMLVPPPAEVGFTLSQPELDAARVLLKAHPAVDVHSHPGRTFVDGAKGLPWKLKLYALRGTFEERVVEDMKAGGLAAVGFSAVADFPVLDLGKNGLSAAREFEPGEAWKYHLAQVANLKKLVDSGLVTPVLVPDDVIQAHNSGRPGAFFSAEGGDFLEGKIGRVEEIFNQGIRMLTPMHYHSNEIGDIITAAPVHGGLTGFGSEVIGEMNRLGMMIDVSHASEKTALAIIAKSSKPVSATHTHVSGLGMDHPRFISKELARAVIDNGGYLGAWPAGIGISTLSDFVGRIEQLIKFAGVDHVAIGSDMDANYKPVYDNFRNLPLIVGEMLKRGHKEEDVAKVIGGNFMRVFAAHLG